MFVFLLDYSSTGDDYKEVVWRDGFVCVVVHLLEYLLLFHSTTF